MYIYTVDGKLTMAVCIIIRPHLNFCLCRLCFFLLVCNTELSASCLPARPDPSKFVHETGCKFKSKLQQLTQAE